MFANIFQETANFGPLEVMEVFRESFMACGVVERISQPHGPGFIPSTAAWEIPDRLFLLSKPVSFSEIAFSWGGFSDGLACGCNQAPQSAPLLQSS